MNHENIMLSERSQTQKTTLVYVGMTNLQRQKVDEWLPAAEGETGSNCKRRKKSFGGDRYVLKLDCGDSGTNLLNLLKLIEPYTQIGRILWYITYTSIKLFKKSV